MTPKWARPVIDNVLLDINGVLFESGEDQAIEGSVEALNRLVENGVGFCLVTNECTTAKRLLAEKLQKFGYHCVTPDKIISPAPAACQYILDNSLKPRLHVWDGVIEDFEPALRNLKSTSNEVNCIVVGDVVTKLSRDFMDESLETMLNCSEIPKIISLGAGRYYKDSNKLRMDTGAYVAAFEYSLNVKAINIGKPDRQFFEHALKVVNGTPSNTVMIGDDIVSDVGGAQALGMRGFLVRTGKYIMSDETNRGVKADEVFDNLRDAVDKLLSTR